MSRRRRWVALTLGMLAVLALLIGGAAAYVIGPRNIIGMLRYDQRKEGALRVGDEAPDVPLVQLDGRSRLRLRTLMGSKPLVLIFGSYT